MDAKAPNYSPLSWEPYYDKSRDVKVPDSEDVFRVYEGGSGPFCYVLLHGGGHSAMSWAVVASHLRQHAQVFAFDMRGHGFSQVQNESDLSIGTLSDDVVRVVKAFFAETKIPPLVVVGHSMGGAVAVRVASMKKLPVAGLCVVDVVEGTAIPALAHMTNVLRNRPSSFPSVEAAIQWAIKSGTVQSNESARVSIPPQIRKAANGSYVWRTDLMSSEKYWRAWFEGMSKAFTTAPAARLLLLANADRLDTELEIARMQGKFQVSVVMTAGHCVQEDAPEQTAKILHEFAKRNRFGVPLILPKPLGKLDKPIPFNPSAHPGTATAPASRHADGAASSASSSAASLSSISPASSASSASS